MKYAWKNLCTFIRTERMIFLLVLLCVSSSTIVLHFAYGLYQNYHVIRRERENHMDSLTIPVVDPSRVTKGALESCLMSFSDNVNDAVINYLVNPVLEPESSLGHQYGWGFFDVRFTIRDHQIAPCEILKHNLEVQGELLEGRYFTAEEEASGALVALAGCDQGSVNSCMDAVTVQNDADGYLIRVGGQVYTVVGVVDNPTPFLPFKALPEDTPLERAVYIGMNQTITRSQYEEIRQVMTETFQDAIEFPELDLTETEDIYLYNTIMMIAAAISLVAAANFSILYQYMLEQRQRETAIFRICGCSKGKAMRIFLAECLLIMLPVYLLSAIVYMKLILPGLQDMFPYMEASYDAKVLLAIFAIYFTATLLVLFLMITSQMHRATLVDSKGRCLV